MKKNLLFALAAMGILAACNKNLETPAGEVDLVVSVDGVEAATKADSNTPYTTLLDGEAAVHSVQILIFDTSGKLNVYHDAGNALTSKLRSGMGTKRVYAVVNGPDCSTVATETELNNKTLPLTTWNKSDSFVMTGRKEVDITSYYQGTSVSITVYRKVLRMVLSRLDNHLSSALGTLKIKHIFIANGGADLTVDPSNPFGAAAIGYNANGKNADGQIVDGVAHASDAALMFASIDQEVPLGGSYTPDIPVPLYAYPHSATPEIRFVAAVEIAGTTYYYPLSITNPLNNYTYTLDMDIKNIGATDPGENLVWGTADIDIRTEPWFQGPYIKTEY